MPPNGCMPCSSARNRGHGDGQTSRGRLHLGRRPAASPRSCRDEAFQAVHGGALSTADYDERPPRGAPRRRRFDSTRRSSRCRARRCTGRRPRIPRRGSAAFAIPNAMIVSAWSASTRSETMAEPHAFRRAVAGWRSRDDVPPSGVGACGQHPRAREAFDGCVLGGRGAVPASTSTRTSFFWSSTRLRATASSRGSRPPVPLSDTRSGPERGAMAVASAGAPPRAADQARWGFRAPARGDVAETRTEHRARLRYASRRVGSRFRMRSRPAASSRNSSVGASAMTERSGPLRQQRESPNTSPARAR